MPINIQNPGEGGAVDSVNGQLGTVVLTTTDVAEGSNLYYTDARVKTLADTSSTAKILYVSKDVGNDSNDGSLLKPFLTIQAGINAAEAISAFYNQVIVRVTPGSTGNGYNENITFSQQGVILEAAPVTRRSDSCIIKGNITVNLTGTSGGANFVAASNIVYIKGFILTASSGTTLAFSGSTFQRLFLSDCYFDNTSTSSAIVLTNTGTSGGTKSTISAFECDINNSSASNPTIKVSAGRFFSYSAHSDIANANSSGQSLLVDGASAAGPSVIINGGEFTGQVSVTDNTATVFLSLVTINSGSAAAIVTPSSPSTGFISLGNVGLTTTNTTSISGSGVVALGGVYKLSTGGDIASTVTQVPFNTFPQGATLIGATATQTTNTLLTIKNGHRKSQQTTAPTTTLQAGAGSTATRSLTNGTDEAGHISITVNGSGIAAGAQVDINFNKAYNVAPIVTLTPTNGNGTGVGAYGTSTTAKLTVNFNAAGTAGQTYTFDYRAIETQ